MQPAMLATVSPTWTKVSAPPPKASSAWTPWHVQRKATQDAIDEDVLAPVLGCGKDVDELWLAYGQSLRSFPHFLRALSGLYEGVEQPKTASSQVSKAVSEQVAPLIQHQIDVERLVQIAFRNLRRCQKVVARLQGQRQFVEFLKTSRGQMWISAAYGFSWGLLGLRFITRSTDIDQFSQEDLFFCLTLVEAGPRDSFAFARTFELDLAAASDDPGDDDFDVGDMASELAAIEAEEFEESEKLLDRVEHGG